LALTKYWCQQNVGVDKILASTKFWRQQNVGVDKILVMTKCWRQQNLGFNKILASTKSWLQQNLGFNKILASTRKNLLTVWLGRVAAADFSQTLLKISFSLMVLFSSHVVAKCGVASVRSAFIGGLSPYYTDLLYRPAMRKMSISLGPTKLAST
jgi:hypothetical protein